MPENNRLTMDFESLGHLREELALEAHLFNAELRERWIELEDDWDHLKQQMHRVGIAAQTSGQDVNAAARLLLESLHNGYQSVRKALHP